MTSARSILLVASLTIFVVLGTARASSPEGCHLLHQSEASAFVHTTLGVSPASMAVTQHMVHAGIDEICFFVDPSGSHAMVSLAMHHLPSVADAVRAREEIAGSIPGAVTSETIGGTRITVAHPAASDGTSRLTVFGTRGKAVLRIDAQGSNVDEAAVKRFAAMTLKRI